MATTKQSARGAGDRDFVLERVVNAPRQLVYEAWTDPAQVAQWWGPHEFTNPVCELDVRPGGAYRITMRGPDGIDYPIVGTYREVEAPVRLVMTMDCSGHPDSWHDAIRPDRAKDDKTLNLIQTVTFEDLDGKTRITIHSRFDTKAIRDAMVEAGMRDGGAEMLDRLEQVLAQRP